MGQPEGNTAALVVDGVLEVVVVGFEVGVVVFECG